MSTELAWAAGFFEGEGCVTYNSNKPRRTLKLTVGQSGYDCPPPLTRFATAVGLGKITGPYGPYLPNRKPAWHWNVSGEDMHVVMNMLLPYLTWDSEKYTKYVALCEEVDVVGGGSVQHTEHSS